MAGLPETMPLGQVVAAFETAWQANLLCRESFTRLITRQGDLTTIEQRYVADVYPYQLKRLNEISLYLGELAAPLIVDQMIKEAVTL
jgi:hypothetical protein